MTLRYMIWKIVTREKFLEERNEFSIRCTEFEMPGRPPGEIPLSSIICKSGGQERKPEFGDLGGVGIQLIAEMIGRDEIKYGTCSKNLFCKS